MSYFLDEFSNQLLIFDDGEFLFSKYTFSEFHFTSPILIQFLKPRIRYN